MRTVTKQQEKDIMLNIVKNRCGIAESVKVYDTDIELYIRDCLADMSASGVPERLIENSDDYEGVVTAVSLYVKAYLGNDRTDTEKYLQLYRNKVFRLSLEEGGT